MSRARSSYRFMPAILLVCAALLTLATRARAHTIGLSRGDYHVTGQGLDVTLALARGEVGAAVPSLDPDGDGALDEARLAAAEPALNRDMIAKIRVTAEGVSCTGSLVGAALMEQDGLEVRARYVCPEGSDRLTVTLAFLDDLSNGHRHAARAVAGPVTTEHLLFRRQPAFEVERGATAVSGALSSSGQWGGFVRMGVEHILIGYDHVLFLFALVLAGGTLRSLAGAITAFTAAHSLTLGLAVLGFITPPARFIEPAIALSVAYVGAENFLARPRARYWMTFPFGLLHGFGFAGALGEVSIPRAEVPWALLSFNVGVEIGQLVWIVVLGLLVAQLRRFEWFGRRAVPLLSVAVVIVGLVWFVGRLHDGATIANGVAHAGLWRG
jgi:hydrogenase/urease accessory protein HupE